MKDLTRLKEQNLRLEQKIGALKVIINDFAKRFNNISNHKNTEIYKLIKDFTEFANEVK